MLDIPNQFTAKILAEISDEDLHKYGKELDAHVTVKYGLHTSNPKDVFDVCENWGKFPIHVTVDNFSLFRNEEFDVLKMEVKSPALVALNKVICDEFEFTDVYTDYIPHVTLAYLKSGMGTKYVKLLNEKFPNFKEIIKSNTLVFNDKEDKETTRTL